MIQFSLVRNEARLQEDAKVRLAIPEVWWSAMDQEPNVAFFQIDIKLPGELEFVFLSGEVDLDSRLKELTGEDGALILKENEQLCCVACGFYTLNNLSQFENRLWQFMLMQEH